MWDRQDGVSLGGTGRYERGSAIAANRPLFVPPWSPFVPLTSFACLSLHMYIIGSRLFRYHVRYRYSHSLLDPVVFLKRTFV